MSIHKSTCTSLLKLHVMNSTLLFQSDSIRRTAEKLLSAGVLLTLHSVQRSAQFRRTFHVMAFRDLKLDWSIYTYICIYHVWDVPVALASTNLAKSISQIFLFINRAHSFLARYNKSVRFHSVDFDIHRYRLNLLREDSLFKIEILLQNKNCINARYILDLSRNPSNLVKFKLGKTKFPKEL